MPDESYRDLLILDDDLALDAGGNPRLVTDRACIAQDIQHMIRESGLLVDLVGERNVMARKTNLVRLTLMVDQDYRIKPGTARIEEHWTSTNQVEFWLTAETIRFGKITFLLENEAREGDDG